MSTAPKAREKRAQEVPEYLIYEIVDGKPIYYKGYQEVLNGTKKLEEIIGDSTLQAWLKAQLTGILYNALMEKGYEITTGELGLKLPGSTERAADIGIFKAERLELSPHYSPIPPDIVIEVDVQADTDSQSEMEYILKKLDDYLSFGTAKVIWIFTDSQKVMVATAQKPWLTYGWGENIEVLPGLFINVQQIVGRQQKGPKSGVRE